MLKRIELYTDGACSGNPGPGGWGYLLRYKEAVKENYGGSAQTTNNQMELTAVIEGLKAVKEPCQIDLYTDSKYVLKGCEKWLSGWKKNHWKKADKKPVLNQELWQELDSQLSRHQITWHWVKGHAGHPENERVDSLACMGRDLFNPQKDK